MLAPLTLLAVISKLILSTDAYFILGHKILETTRFDPIVNPGGISGHVHTIAGGNNFNQTQSYASSLQSTCTTASITLDKSNYWTPQLYFWNQTVNQFTMIPVSFMNTYYLPRPAFTGENITAFPPGLRMLSGNPTLRTFDKTNPDQLAISYVCLDVAGGNHQSDPAWAQRNNFFEHNCPGGMRAQVNFRSCWDGVNLDSSDHASHMSWPSGGVNGGSCPKSHPVHLPMLFYEVIYEVQNFPYVNGSWVFAMGDPTGYGMHGDFLMGWQNGTDGTNVLQAAIDGCNADNGVGGVLSNCPPFVPYLNSKAADACQPLNPIVNENIGDYGKWINTLPGNNPVKNANGQVSPVTNTTTTTPGLTPTQETIPNNYTLIGCIAEGTSGRALKGSSKVDMTSMTLGACVNFCSSGGFAYAGVEYGGECYCDNALRNGANTTTLLPSTSCGNPCPGNNYENCGGSSTLTLYISNVKAAVAATSTSVIPSGWNVTGCMAEPSSGRALVGASFSTSTNMSRGACLSYCGAAGYPLAGVEYGQECRCGYQLANNATGALLDMSKCGMACSNGSFVETCGGSSTFLLYTNPSLNPVYDTLPAGWTPTGCRTDSSTSTRALGAYTTSSNSMTQAKCVAACAGKGYTIAGVEYATQCYCANSYGAGQGLVAADSSCSMACGGKSNTICGGSSRLTTFAFSNTTSSTLVVPANSTCSSATTVTVVSTQTVYVTATAKSKRRISQ